MTDKIYAAIVYSEGKPVIGRASQEPDGLIRLCLWLMPQDGLVYLKPRKSTAKKKG